MISALLIEKQGAWERLSIFNEYCFNYLRIVSSTETSNVLQAIVLRKKENHLSNAAVPYFRLQIGQINHPSVVSDC
jgi:hypothetical protein